MQLELNTKKYNFLYYILANIFLLFYIVMSIVLYISFKKDNPENIPLYLTAIYPIPFLLIFIGLYIPGIIQLTKLPINKQDKLILLLS